MFSGKEQGGWEKGLLLPCQDGAFSTYRISGI
jgi:hypothetical protein